MVTVVIQSDPYRFSEIRKALINDVKLILISENPGTGTIEGLVYAAQVEKINSSDIPGITGVEASKQFRYSD